METLINPLSVTLTFGLLLSAIALWKPEAARIFLGLFFLVMALGVNVPVLLNDADLFAEAGKNALLPVYRWFFNTVLPWNPVVFAIPLILFEIVVGALTLSKNRLTHWGLAGATFFCLAIAPVGMEEIASPAIALAAALLMRQSYPHSLVEMIVEKWGKKGKIVTQKS